MLSTRFTRRFDLKYPIALAPMDPASGGRLAAAVSNAGALGLLGGGYGSHETLQKEFDLAGDAAIGCGFITWSMGRDVSLLEKAIERRPRALMLSFSDPEPFARKITDAGIPLICQVQTLDHVQRAVDCGATVIVAQGTEAGGHGFDRQTTMTFTPEVADYLAATSPVTLLLSAGGIADGRGLAAALMLGADGVLMGTRFWATQEALIHQKAKDLVVRAKGGQTVRTSVFDIARGRQWPEEYTGRLMVNDFIRKWHGREDALKAVWSEEKVRVESAYESGDYDCANVTVGQAIGLVADLPPAASVVQRVAGQAERLLHSRNVASLLEGPVTERSTGAALTS
ncbi:NAD(P)H-dependent flavin oxidoreductase [Cupriavidus plantarum]|uniref:NAD(P)H-dependent flavin oxidoreductase n=1 Tax=Cupriavidus plantarum TaxID=942865 RepID=UPI001B20C669|nr:nitronate monooxygenase [Cupriavidus plantarum]CAG2127941.1 NADH:quinone reductase [Cupriavidus plantarum]SMR66881.1 nitronate monooxygenase [Cupriavidus plantarum]